MIRISPDLTLFPYTTLFRSGHRSLAVRSWRLSFAMVVAFVALQPALQTQQPAQPGVGVAPGSAGLPGEALRDRKSTRLNSSHVRISYAVFCLKKKKKISKQT